MSRPTERQLRPVTTYPQHEQYPPVSSATLSRRAFLGSTAAAGALGAGLSLVPSVARAAPKPGGGRIKVSLYVSRRQLGGSNMSARRVDLWTTSKALAKWLRNSSHQRGVTRAFDKVLRKASEKVLVDGKKLYRLERRLGAVLTRHYRQQTGKHVAQPDLMLIIGRYWRPRLRGMIRMPHTP